MVDVGQTVGNYNITAKLGAGGMGLVFLAEHPVIGSKVALKAIHPHFARDSDVVSRFVNEARAVNQIGHEHIVDISDFGTTPDGDFYFIMEYLHGETLADLIGRQGALPPARALNIAAQIADALQASHEQGVIHRDLKPDNIFLITRDATPDFVKVLDFGLAKLTHGSMATPTNNTGAGTVMGTPFYMSPEQCEGRGELDHRADIYALGVMLFEMLTGRVPFGGEGYGEVLIKHISVRPPTVCSLVPDLPPAMDAILGRALAKAPGDRFQTMSAVRAALLDPDGYLEMLPSVVEDDLSERLRTTAPTTRTEITVKLTRLPSARPIPAASTFRQSAGERLVDRPIKRARPRGRSTFLGAATLAAVALAAAAFSSVPIRHQARRLVGSAVTQAKPAVLVNFGSDPDGATVYRSDGTVLGVTPLSIAFPYNDAPVGYRIEKSGYATKESSFVPNLPLAVFALLERNELPALDRAEVRVEHAPPVRIPVVARTPTVIRRRPPQPTPDEPRVLVDEDDVLPPSEP